MIDILTTPWLYVFGVGVIILAHSLLVNRAMNLHLWWHRQQQEHEAEKHGKHLARRRELAREKRESIDSRPPKPNLGEVGGEGETVADVIEKALQEGE